MSDEDPVIELTTDEEPELAPVLRGMVELELKLELELMVVETDALELAVDVIGAECVCVTWVPFSVQRLVKVV